MLPTLKKIKNIATKPNFRTKTLAEAV